MASQSIEMAKMHRPKLIPSCSDVEKVNGLLAHKMESDNYATLAKATLCAITLFNRKRGGELQRMKRNYLEDGLSTGMATDPEVLRGFEKSEKRLAEIFDRVEIRGKFNRRVAILLTPKMKSALDRLKDMQNQMGLVSKYMFASPTGQRPYRGSDAIREFIQEAGSRPTGCFPGT